MQNALLLITFEQGNGRVAKGFSAKKTNDCEGCRNKLDFAPAKSYIFAMLWRVAKLEAGLQNLSICVCGHFCLVYLALPLPSVISTFGGTGHAKELTRPFALLCFLLYYMAEGRDLRHSWEEVGMKWVEVAVIIGMNEWVRGVVPISTDPVYVYSVICCSLCFPPITVVYLLLPGTKQVCFFL